MRNPKLFRAMQKVFGETPRIINEGSPCRLTGVYAEYSFVPKTQELPAKSTSGGEQYAVNCKFCNDTRHRLYISHMWDTEFVQGNCRYHCSDRLMRCWNEECVSDKNDETRLNRQRIINSLREAMGSITEIDEDELVPTEDEPQCALANQCLYPEDAKHLTDPNTPDTVKSYLAARGFDLKTLYEDFRIDWIDRYGKFHHPILVVPVYQNGDYWFWQGRLVPIDGTVRGEVERDRSTGYLFPKYYFPHGVKKAWSLYNMDAARLRDTVCIVEGVTDVWAIGNNPKISAVAKFGRSVSVTQLDLLTKQFFNKHIILVPDMDDPEALKEANEDLIRLRAKGVFRSVEIALLPEGKDPCDLLKDYPEKGGVACAIEKAVKSSSPGTFIGGTFGGLATL